MSVRQLTRKFKPGSLSGFWNGSNTVNSCFAPQQATDCEPQNGWQVETSPHEPWQGNRAPGASARHPKGLAAYPEEAGQPLASSAAQEVEDLTSEASSSELSPALSEAAEDGFSQPLHEAVQQLLDPQSPVQAATSPNQHGREPSAVLAATGNVDEQPVSAISWATAPEQARAEDVAKACQLMDHSMLDGRPIISIHTSGEAAQDTVPPTTSLTAEQSTEVSAVTQQQQQQPSNHGQILQRHVEASGVVPQILLAEHGRLSSHGQIASQLSDFTFLVQREQAGFSQSSSRRTQPFSSSTSHPGSSVAARELQSSMPREATAAASQNRRLGWAFSRFHGSFPSMPSRGLADSLWDPVQRPPAHLARSSVDSSCSSTSSLVSSCLEAASAPALTSLPHPWQFRSLQEHHATSNSRTMSLSSKAKMREQAARQPEQSGRPTELAPLPHVAGIFPDFAQALAATRQLLSFMGRQSSQASDTSVGPCLRLGKLAAAAPQLPGARNVRLQVLQEVLDHQHLMEIGGHWGCTAQVGFGRLAGQSVGFVLPEQHTSAQGSAKVARFIRFCDSFSFPLLILLDPSPGQQLPPQLPSQPEHLQGAAQLMFAFVEASVPKLALLLSPDQAASLINAQALKADVVLAWPAAAPQLPVEPPPHQVSYASHTSSQGSHSSDGSSSSSSSFHASFARPLAANGKHGCIDAVIRPEHTRAHLIAELALLQGKHEPRAARKHSNMPIG